MTRPSSLRRMPRFRDLPLFSKLLLPFLMLLLAIAAAGAYLVVRDLSSRARAQLNQELLVHSLNARSRIHDRELYLLESVDFAANLDGMAAVVQAGDATGATRLLQSVLALKTDLNLLALVRADGTGLVEFLRRDPGGQATPASGNQLNGTELVTAALQSDSPARPAGLVSLGATSYLVIATPVCAGQDECLPVGVALAGIRLDLLAAEASGSPTAGEGERPVVAIYDGDGRHQVAASGPAPQTAATPHKDGALVRRTGDVGGRKVTTLFGPLDVQGRHAGYLSATIPTGPAMAIASRAAIRLALLLFAAMAGVVGVGMLLSRYVLAQVRPLVRTSRALGRGELDARIPVVSRDELGELAGVLNQMADQLQASHETLERRVEERTQAIRELLAERTEFFTGISHELRTPVAVILSEARMMLDPTYQTPRGGQAENAETIVRSAEQLLARVNQILELARMESGRIEVDVADVSLPDVIGELHATMSGLASASGLTLSVDVPLELPAVRADPSRLQDVVLNLVSNAVKYTPPEGRVEVAGTTKNGTVQLAVSDTGVGIPAEVGDRVFEPFYQVPGTRAQGGQASSGLGLALAKRLVEAQGGTIVYTSVPDEGTTFTVVLQPATQPSRSGRSARSRATPSGGRRSRPAPGDGRRGPAPGRAS